VKIAFFHNPKAGSATFKVSNVVRRVEAAGNQVRYVSIKDKAWEQAFGEPIDRAIVAGGDGSVSRLAPWLAARKLPFCILPLGTANNCARALGQMHAVETIIANIGSPLITKIDLGLITAFEDSRCFIESAGIGLLPLFMNEMRSLQKENAAKLRTGPRKRLANAKKYLAALAKDFTPFECELLADDEVVKGEFLLLEIANAGLIGPGLNLAPVADAGDGFFNLVWVSHRRRDEWLTYLKLLRKGEESPPPVEERRCQRITFCHADVPLHIDGKVFPEMATPLCVSIHQGALELIRIAPLSQNKTNPR
jgi:diacylglycerol kinase family enzyme